jgi:hypothetical protein
MFSHYEPPHPYAVEPGGDYQNESRTGKPANDLFGGASGGVRRRGRFNIDIT